MTNPGSRPNGSDVLASWEWFEAAMEAVRGTDALREAVRSLQTIAGAGGAAAEMAKEALARVEHALIEEWMTAHPTYGPPR